MVKRSLDVRICPSHVIYVTSSKRHFVSSVVSTCRPSLPIKMFSSVMKAPGYSTSCHLHLFLQILHKLNKLRSRLVLQLLLRRPKNLFKDRHELRSKLLDGGLVCLV